MRKIYLQIIFYSFLFGVNGTVIFYDGTSFDGEIVSVDPLYVYIIPTGLPLPEEILTEYVATLILDNGFIIVENSRAVQGYKNDKFIILDDYSFKDPWKSDQYFFESGLNDYYSKSYGDYRKEERLSEDQTNDSKYIYAMPQPYSGMETSITGSQKRQTLNTRLPLVKSNTYGSIAFFGGYPVYQSTSLSWITKDYSDGITLPNMGAAGTIPFKLGPLSGFGGHLMTMGFMSEYKESHSIKAIQAAAYVNLGISSLLNFLPQNIKMDAYFGPSYHIGWNVPYTGIGIVFGGNLDYWFDGKPVGIRLFNNTHIIPGPGTKSDDLAKEKGAFSTMGFALLTSFALTSR
ncbi:MAG: hypothetical protein CMG74_02775 [Candidatus Marinimicrobia bacterium]|nr:hypothetical protein [Candidatus Neomarinimicrobiota bacterium]